MYSNNKYYVLAALCHSNLSTAQMLKNHSDTPNRKNFNLYYYILLIECNCRGLFNVNEPVACINLGAVRKHATFIPLLVHVSVEMVIFEGFIAVR